MDRETARRLIAEGLSPQKLSDEHEERLAELAAPVPVTEARNWTDASPAGRFRDLEHITTRVDFDAAEKLVAETRQSYRARYGKELSEGQLAAVRRQAELRSVIAEGGREHPTTHALAERHGWGVATPVRDRGVARLEGGRWQGDPEVADAMTAADQLHAERTAPMRVTGMYLSGNGVAGPS